jgi:hypothetical protein
MNKQKTYLFIAILIPILMISIVVFSLFIPVKKIIPPYNVLYAIGDSSESYTCLQNTMAKFFPKTMNINYYKVKQGSCNKVKLYIYDFKNDSFSAIAFKDAMKLHLKQYLTTDSGNFYVSRDCYTGPNLGLWSMRSTYNDVCLEKGDYKRLLNVKPEVDSESFGKFFYFISIGWIVTETPAKQEIKHE